MKGRCVYCDQFTEIAWAVKELGDDSFDRACAPCAANNMKFILTITPAEAVFSVGKSSRTKNLPSVGSVE